MLAFILMQFTNFCSCLIETFYALCLGTHTRIKVYTFSPKINLFKITSNTNIIDVLPHVVLPRWTSLISASCYYDNVFYLLQIFAWLGLSNSSVNFIIYGATNKHYRKIYKNFFYKILFFKGPYRRWVSISLKVIASLKAHWNWQQQTLTWEGLFVDHAKGFGGLFLLH